MKKLFNCLILFIIFLLPQYSLAAKSGISIKTNTAVVSYPHSITISGHIQPRKRKVRVYLYSSPLETTQYHFIKSTKTNLRGNYHFHTKITKAVKIKTQIRIKSRKIFSVPKRIYYGDEAINQYYIAKFTILLNKERTANNLRPAVNNPAINQATLAKVQHMIDNDYFAHCWNGICDSYFYSYACSCLGVGYPTPESMLNGWLTSPYGHRNCVLLKDLDGYDLHFGIAYKQGYWAFFTGRVAKQN